VPEARSRGYGTETQRQLARYPFAHTQVNRIEAETEIANIGEQRAWKRLIFAGRECCGVIFRHGQRRDCVIYSLLRPEADLNLK